jgi:hypothetical protein
LSRHPRRHTHEDSISGFADLEIPLFDKEMFYHIAGRLHFTFKAYTQMSNSLFQSSQHYRALGHRLNRASPGYQGLHEFVNIKEDTCESAPKFTIFTINPKEQQDSSESSTSLRAFEGTANLAEYLTHLQDQGGSCNIFLVENICPETIALSGGFFDNNP